MNCFFDRLKLIQVAIRGRKRRSSALRTPLCYLDNINSNDLSMPTPNHRKSRLALVLRKDGTLLWDTVVLSNEMHFTSKPFEC